MRIDAPFSVGTVCFVVHLIVRGWAWAVLSFLPARLHARGINKNYFSLMKGKIVEYNGITVIVNMTINQYDGNGAMSFI